MRRQRNTAQIKEQNKTPEKELNKKEISYLSDAEFKTLVIRMHKELTGYTQAEMKVTLSQGCQTHFHQGPHQPPSCIQTA